MLFEANSDENSSSGLAYVQNIHQSATTEYLYERTDSCLPGSLTLYAMNQAGMVQSKAQRVQLSKATTVLMMETGTWVRREFSLAGSGII